MTRISVLFTAAIVVGLSPWAATLPALADKGFPTDLADGAPSLTPQTVPDSFDPGANGAVRALAVQPDGMILVGGMFTAIGGENRSRLARLSPTGGVDPGFLADINGQIDSIVLLPDGKILVGGDFTSVNDMFCQRIVRLHPDGSLDSDFTARANGLVSAILVQPDGRILLGGEFTDLNGVDRQHIGRLLPDGALDKDFAPSADYCVQCIALQPDGKILISGFFTSVNSQPQSYIARLQANGTLDPGFIGSASYWVHAVALQPDGRMAVGGPFFFLNGQARSKIGRFAADGELDSTFDPGSDSSTYTLALQADGGILATGHFITMGGATRNHAARILANGTLDTDFNPGSNGEIYCVAVQADGSVLLGGIFSEIGGLARRRIARIPAGIAPQSDLVFRDGSLEWRRGGSAPEVWRTTFEHTEDGITFTLLGAGSRVVGGWRMTEPLPIGGFIRARGYTTSGMYASSGGIVEEMAELRSLAGTSAVAWDDKPRVVHELRANSQNASGVAIASLTNHGGTTHYTQPVYAGTRVHLRAPLLVGEGADRRRFVEWTGDESSADASLIFDMRGDTTVNAVYADAPVEWSVVAWGRKFEGQSTLPADLGEIAAVSAGHFHSIALRRDGTVVGWGDNNNGQASTPAGLSDIVTIDAGDHHNLAIQSDGSVLAWGWNADGQCTVPAGLSDAVAVAGGGWHSLALKADGTVVAWGRNDWGQISIPEGLADVVAIAAGYYFSLALKADGTVVGWGGNDHGQISVPSGLADVVAIAAGHHHGAARRADGTVVSWGIHADEMPSDLAGIVRLDAGAEHTIAQRKNGNVQAWGWNNDGQCRTPPGLSGVVALSGGSMHTLALGTLTPSTHSLVVQTINPTAGVVIASRTGHGGTSSCGATVPHGTAVSLEAPEFVGNGATRKRFSEWTGDVPSPECALSFTMETDRTVCAVYIDSPAMAPAGGCTVASRRPEFNWPAIAGATRYRVWLNRNGTVHLTQWAQGENAWVPDDDLPAGTYRWWVQPWSADSGNGAWSVPADFHLAARRPRLVVQLAPEEMQDRYDQDSRSPSNPCCADDPQAGSQ